MQRRPQLDPAKASLPVWNQRGTDEQPTRAAEAVHRNVTPAPGREDAGRPLLLQASSTDAMPPPVTTALASDGCRSARSNWRRLSRADRRRQAIAPPRIRSRRRRCVLVRSDNGRQAHRDPLQEGRGPSHRGSKILDRNRTTDRERDLRGIRTLDRVWARTRPTAQPHIVPGMYVFGPSESGSRLVTRRRPRGIGV
jgi:hypothetical protein